MESENRRRTVTGRSVKTVLILLLDPLRRSSSLTDIESSRLLLPPLSSAWHSPSATPCCRFCLDAQLQLQVASTASPVESKSNGSGTHWYSDGLFSHHFINFPQPPGSFSLWGPP